MPESVIAGIPVHFPFEPYNVQRDYMEKVIICLRDGTNGVLESPTGTGKTLSLLCASLAWIRTRQSEHQQQMIKLKATSKEGGPGSGPGGDLSELAMTVGQANNWGVPKVIYASRTHSQLNQAMRELKRTAYANMRSVVLGSRDQLCIHPEVMKEQGNSNKVNLCKLRVHSKTCTFQLRVESKKDHPDFRGPSIMDIEDLVRVGQKLKMCPYYASKELVAQADITFMPYNYLLDPKARKANKIELGNTIIILDEAHNIEKICEESASVQIRSSDVAMAIEDVTHIMKVFTSGESQEAGGDEPKDFTLDDLTLLKEMLLELEKAIDAVVVDNPTDGTTYPASLMYELLGKANFTYGNCATIVALLDKLVQYLMVASQHMTIRKGGTFTMLSDLLTIVFANKENIMSKVHLSFKVHVQVEESNKQQGKSGAIQGKQQGWLGKGNITTTGTSSKAAKIVNFWCFNPGFGMEQLLNTQVRSVILTSGTLAPLKPLIAELAIPVAQHLENPHIVDQSQVYVKIIGTGPDRQQLISNFKNRDNPKYISSLGQTILNVARIVPDGLLVFFPSYPMLNKCVDAWQASGLWADISCKKPIFVEPRGKDQFTSTMEEFYQAIRDSKGAVFMAVCRGKVSEGLDFADRNGRAVIITGLPFPPLKDPKVILKRRYLETNRTKENQLLSGQEWYNLDATRAVNQAIGRVIRHRNDYGAILLCDSRFQDASQVQQLSKWIRGHLGARPQSSPFGPIVRELRQFFKHAEETMKQPDVREEEQPLMNVCKVEEVGTQPVIPTIKQEPGNNATFRKANKSAIKVEMANSINSWTPADYASAAGRTLGKAAPNAMDFMSRLDSNVSSIDFNCSGSADSGSGGCGSSSLVTIHKRERSSPGVTDTVATQTTKKRYKLAENIKTEPKSNSSQQVKVAPESRADFLRELRSLISQDQFRDFGKVLIEYRSGTDENFESLMTVLLDVLAAPKMRYLFIGMRRFLRNEHKAEFDVRLASLNLAQESSPNKRIP
ncbi:GL14463 [Drosophila persimilis]|uniref:Regulator of telomere elongation helicase 1 homolog n=1 Tax=Drosophila persimilis TaxID=7234 RepID=RTEL1_DROPE|nr:regulator of telomere elongation helicase 1 homolog [Drosophila persimilis]XP_026845847.1 regulator of telomere elongation helicase 1 homolog [Drosophila persimilis]B4GU19.1 RecName: Full=Regulator of telomere elongation helicase 1 homolog [Drosophila persimilis]EDW26039.1 GL14463 [Drosophila persimilis]